MHALHLIEASCLNTQGTQVHTNHEGLVELRYDITHIKEPLSFTRLESNLQPSIDQLKNRKR